MMMSPSSSRPASWSTTLPVMPAGIITQIARGRSSLATKSSSVVAPTAPSDANFSTDSALVSKATAVCPSRMIRRTMFAPIRPRPTIPSCMCSIPSTGRTVAADQFVRGAVVLQLRLDVGRQFVGDLLGQDLAQFDAPLVEGVDRPDRALHEHAVLVERH